MKRKFTASVSREGKWHVAQCLEVDVASQGRTERTALKNLQQALALHFAHPAAAVAPRVRAIEVKLRAA
jgi:predicted RNase H-like HicB family nuclease